MTVLTTSAGPFRLRIVRPEDLPLITGWMNDPVVDAFWELAGPPEVTERHVRAQLDGDGRSVPQLGLLNGVPMSYWEVYRVEQDRLAGYYRADPGDIGLHLLLGPPESRGRGLGGALLSAMAEHLLRTSPGWSPSPTSATPRRCGPFAGPASAARERSSCPRSARR